MKKIIFLMMAASVLVADIFEVEPKSRYGLELEMGYRGDELLWNIGNATYNAPDGNSYTPDILSELQWNDLRSFYGKVALKGEEGRYRLNIFYLRSFHDRKGSNQDSDYLYSGRQGEFSRSNNGTDGSYFESYGLRLGEVYEVSSKVNATIWIGYEEDKQYLKINNGYQTLDPNGWFGGTGVIAGLDSSYHARWRGPMAGLSGEFELFGIGFDTGIFYHWLKYDAKATWNLRTDLMQPVSFEHESNRANALEYHLRAEVPYSQNVLFFAHYNYKKSTLQGGVHTVYGSDGSVGSTRLHEVESRSNRLGLGIKIKF